LSILDQSGVLGSSKLPRRANTEIRPKKLNREAGYGITAVEELSGVQNLISEDIIVVYVSPLPRCITKRYKAILTVIDRVMGPTGTGKSTVSASRHESHWNVVDHEARCSLSKKPRIAAGTLVTAFNPTLARSRQYGFSSVME